MTSNTRLRGLAASGAALGLVVGMGGIAFAADPTPAATATTTPAAATESAAPKAATAQAGGRQVGAQAILPTTDAACTSTKPLTLFNINDFHGRIFEAGKLFTPVETLRATQADVVLASAGDNVGASIFESFIQEDNPTIDVLNAAGLAVSAPGNHEFDRGHGDLKGHIQPRADFDYVVANMTGTDMLPYKVVTTTSGIRVAYIGAEVVDLPSLVSPAGITGLTVTPEVAAVNKVADEIAAADKADVIVAEVHNNAQTGYSKNVDVVFNGHTHESYATVTEAGVPVVQAASYGTKLGRVDLAVGAGNVICGTPTAQLVTPPKEADKTLPVIAKIEGIAAAAKESADKLGAERIGEACMNVTRGLTVGKEGSKPGDDRGVESTASDLVADAFFDIAGGGAQVIGLQNPGGTRADIAAGEVTYAQAAAVLPFANTIMTTQLTRAQFKKVLEQQWQRDKDGKIPSRPYLQLGISDNVTYTYDESLPEGSRITSISIHDPVTKAMVAMDPTAMYTIASGSFLITGGDNFTELGRGVNTADTGRSDLEAFVGWVKDTKSGKICPASDKQAASVQVTGLENGLVSCTGPATVVIGQPFAGGVQAETLDFSNGAKAESIIKVTLGKDVVGEYPVKDGIASIKLSAPAKGQGGTYAFTTGNETAITPGLKAAACATGTPTVTPPPTGVYFENCSAAIKAGAAPLKSTDPGYRAALDSDRDGVACEAGQNPSLPSTGGSTGSTAALIGLGAAGAAGAIVARRTTRT